MRRLMKTESRRLGDVLGALGMWACQLIFGEMKVGLEDSGERAESDKSSLGSGYYSIFNTWMLQPVGG